MKGMGWPQTGNVSSNVFHCLVYTLFLQRYMDTCGGKQREQLSEKLSADKTLARSNSSIYPDPPEPIGSFSAGAPSVGGRSPVGRVRAVPNREQSL